MTLWNRCAEAEQLLGEHEIDRAGRLLREALGHAEIEAPLNPATRAAIDRAWRLLHDVLQDDFMSAATSDEISRAWRILRDVLKDDQ